jgi:hypothetical protein
MTELREYQLGPRICDLVVAAPEGKQEYDLEIASCRPKDWNQSLTISYGDHLFELAEISKAEAPRRFVYRLRKAPVSKVVRGLHLYDPLEGTGEEPSHDAKLFDLRRFASSK